jgi:hypothetical protein
MSAGTAAMQTGYGLATQVFTQVLQTAAPSYSLALQQMGAATVPGVLVVDGTYDHMHHILEANNVPHARAPGGVFFSQALKEFPGVRAVLINCAREFPAAEARRVAEFVHRGGMLVTTDWALHNVLEVGFPGTVAWKDHRETGQEFVDVDLVKGNRLPPPNNRVLARIMDAEGGRPKWWLESSSYPITRLADGVEILLYSRQLKVAHGRGSIMVRFRWGDGWVYHMISHAFLQHQAPGGFAACGADAAAAGATRVFTQSVGVNPATAAAYEAAEAQAEGFDAGVAKTTAISTAAFLLPIIEAAGGPVDTEEGIVGTDGGKGK